jgi:hypothetical protein
MAKKKCIEEIHIKHYKRILVVFWSDQSMKTKLKSPGTVALCWKWEGALCGWLTTMYIRTKINGFEIKNFI